MYNGFIWINDGMGDERDCVGNDDGNVCGQCPDDAGNEKFSDTFQTLTILLFLLFFR